MNKTPKVTEMMMKTKVCLQGPGQETKVHPPALVGTTSLSKCSFNSQPLLMPHQDVLSRGHSGGWWAGHLPCGGMSNSLCKINYIHFNTLSTVLFFVENS